MVRARAVLFGVVRSRPNVRILACVQGLALAMVIGFGVSPARADNAPAGVPIISALGSPRSVNQAPSAGAVSEQFDIEVAPGRHDVRPRLSLIYASLGALADSGLGWSLTPGKIERSTTNGVPRLDATDSFVFSINTSASELVAIGGGSFRAKTESDYREFTFDGTSWQMRLPQGVVYRFGNTSDSRVGQSSWMLAGIEDRNGNTVRYVYTQDGGTAYLSEIDYTGSSASGDLGANKITFSYETRPDVRVSYSLGERRTRSQRLTGVSEFAGSTLVRRFALSYQQSPTNGVSLLTGISIVGNDDSSSVTARSYQYSRRDLGWGTNSVGTLPFAFYDSSGKDLGVRTADVNGDNFVDLVRNGTEVWLGDGTGQFTKDDGWSASIAAIGVTFVNGDGLDNGVRLYDINGDFRPDIVIASPDNKQVFLNNGTGWVLDPTYTAAIAGLIENVFVPANVLDPDAACDANCDMLIADPIPFSFIDTSHDSRGVYPTDVNGDGLVDFVWSYENTTLLQNFQTDAGVINRTPLQLRAVYLNTGSGFVRDDTRSESLTQSVLDPFVIDTEIQGYDLLDVNGDGLPDIVRTLQGKPAVVLLNNGHGWELDSAFSDSLAANGQILSYTSDFKSLGLTAADLDGDGLVDYIRADAGTRVAFRNTGTGWVSDTTLTGLIDQADLRLVDSSNATSGDLFADVDGDGLADLLLARSDSALSIRLAPPGVINFLSHAVSGLGETTDLTYAPSSSFNNVGSDGLQDMPIVISVCTSLTRGDGRSHSFVDSYVYAGGAIVDKVFRGFATSDATDSLGTRTRNVFSQSGASAGNLLRTETYDIGGALRARHALTYSTATPVAGVTQLSVTQTDEETFDGTATLHTRVRTSYDAFLNIVEVDRDGDVSKTGDEAQTIIDHASNAALGIFDPVWRLSVFDLSGNLLSRTITIFDDLPPGQVSRGNATQVRDQVDATGAEVVRTMEYDQFGNIVAATDRNGNRTQFVYDDTATFREQVIDPLGHVFRTTYDPGFGVVLRNEDANGEVTLQSYDAFGRLVRTVEPGDEASPNGTKTMTYSAIGDPTTQSVTVSQTETPGLPDTLDTKSFVDGFGQVYHLETEGGGGRTTVLTTEYDEYGAPTEGTVPHFSTDPAPTTTHERDARRRITRTVFPDGLQETTVYLATEKDSVDRQGHTHRTLTDAYGSVTEVHDLTSTGDRATLFQYDLFGNVVQTQNANGELTHVGYDFLGRRTFLDDPAAGRLDYGYDPAGNIVSQIDASGRQLSLTYDTLGRLVEKRLSTGDKTCPKKGNPACEVSNGQAQIVYRFTFDAPGVPDSIGRVGSVSDAAGTVNIRYDARGNVIERRRKTPDGTEYLTGYAYDSLKRLRGVFYPDGYVLRTTYNEASLPVRIDDETGKAVVQSATYSALGRPTSIVFGNGTTTTETYDATLQRLQALQTSGNGEVVQNRQYAYDAGSNITSITDLAFGRSQSFEYDELNRLVHAEGPYGTEHYRYDPLGNLLQKGSLVMRYDSVHQQQLVCGVDASANTPAFRKDFKACFGRAPTAADLTGDTSAHVPSFFASYDPTGNLVARGSASYAYDTENRLLSVNDGHGSTGEVNTYDANGVRVIRNANGHDTVTIDTIFEIDEPRALKHVKLGDMLVATIVKPAGQTRLATEVVFPDDVPQIFAYASGGASFASSQRGMACGISQGGGAPLDLGFVLILAPAWGLSMIGRRRLATAARRARRFFKGVGRRIAVRPGSTGIVALLVVLQLLGGRQSGAAGNGPPPDSRFYYHTDHISSIQAITDDDGHVVRRLDYKPFGEQIDVAEHIPGPPDEIDRSYQSREHDPSQLYYFGARHYDPIIGRFLTADSVISNPKDGAQHHRYAFSLNNPIRYVDPTGHDVLDVILGVVLIVLLVVVAIILLIVPGTEPLGAFLGAVAVGALIGGIAGAVIGGVIAFTLLAEGKISLLDAFRLWSASVLVGMLVGAAIGAIYAGGILAAAAATEHIISGALIGAAVGASVGGTIGAIKGHGFGDDFLRGLLIGALIGAVVGGFLGFSAPGLSSDIITLVNGIGSTFTSSTVLSAGFSAVLIPSLIAGVGSIAAALGVFAYYCVQSVGGPCLFQGVNPFVKDANKEMPPASSLALTSTPVTL
jgi:RHS repeat-associated protein